MLPFLRRHGGGEIDNIAHIPVSTHQDVIILGGAQVAEIHGGAAAAIQIECVPAAQAVALIALQVFICGGGEILLQKAVDVLPEDTAESLQQRVMREAEWILLPKAAELVCKQLIVNS